MAARPDPTRGRGDVRTAAWVRERFHRHYAAKAVEPPDRLSRREFGFIPFAPPMMQRHEGFGTAGDLRDYLVRRVPAHAYHSSAYYETPGAPTMEQKGWLGADLVFDLDADHIPGAKDMSYEGMLEAVRRKIVQLHDDFLVRDFGFDERSMKVVFSGGRGYHVHVSDERVWSLGSHERREMVDYITGKQLDVHGFFRESAFDAKEFRGRVRVKKMLVQPRTAEGGWSGKLARGIVTLAERLEAMPSEEAVAFLATFPAVGGRTGATELHENLFKPRTQKPRAIRGIDRLREDGRLEVLTDANRDRFLSVVLDLQQVRLDSVGPIDLEGIRARGETDEPVTSDIKRLIRLPTSLHGKTGLEVVPLARDALTEFRPLRDAFPSAFGDEPVSMRLTRPFEGVLRDESFNLKPGVASVPEYAAVFLACRGVAGLA